MPYYGIDKKMDFEQNNDKFENEEHMFTITVDTDDSVPYDIQEQTFVTNGGDKMAVTKGKKQENVSDKDKALEAALMQITKQYGQGAVMKLGDDNAALNVEAISTGSISLDLAMGIDSLCRGMPMQF